jgi:hypothetical protein
VFRQLMGSPLWQWIIITLAGFLVGGVVGYAGGFAGIPLIGYPLALVLGALFNTCEGQGAIGCLLIGAVLGASLGLGLTVGIAQWFILRRFITRSRWWILASTLGWCGVGCTLTTMLYTAVPAPGSPDFGKPILEQLPPTLPAIAQVTIAGTLMGLFQWLILRLTLRQSLWWIPLNSVIMLLAALGVLFLGYSNIGGISGMGLFIVSFSPIYAIASGMIFNWLVSDYP